MLTPKERDKRIKRRKKIWHYLRNRGGLESSSERKADNDSLTSIGFGEGCDVPDEVDNEAFKQVLSYWMPYIKRRVAKTSDMVDRRRELIQCARIKIWQVVAKHGAEVSAGLVWDAIKKSLGREDLRDKRRSSYVLRIRIGRTQRRDRSYYQYRRREVEDRVIYGIDREWAVRFYERTTGKMKEGLEAFMSDMSMTEWANNRNVNRSSVMSALGRAIAFGRALQDIRYKMSSPVDPIEALRRKGLTVNHYYKSTKRYH